MSDVYYEAQPKQLQFHKATADEVLYGGAAGGGKSFAILWDAVGFCLAYEKAHVAIFRRKFPELEKSIILEFLDKVPNYLYEYNKKEHRAYFTNGSILEFNHCEHDSHVFDYQSAQYDRIYFDELTHFSNFAYTYLMTRCRTVKKGITPQIKSGTNPGNVGHEWVKKRFVDGVIPNKVTEKKDKATDLTYTVQYIPAKIYDNPKLLDADPGYIARLKKLPTEQRKALLEGDWNVFEGQFFREWDEKVHVCQPFKIPKWWVKFRSIDWGFAKPTVVLWYAVSPEGRVYVYRELERTRIPDTQLVKEMKEYSKGETYAYTVADPSLWSINQYERGESIALRLMYMGIPLMKADNNRIAGWNVIHSYLEHSENKKPRLQVFSTCYRLIETLPGLVHDQKNPEDVDTNGDDHAADSLRYGLMTRPHLSKRPFVKPPAQSFESIMNRSLEERKLRGYVGYL